MGFFNFQAGGDFLAVSGPADRATAPASGYGDVFSLF
jgi:hypothetical protein